MVEIDLIARRYGVRPSEIMKGKMSDYQFDCLALGCGLNDENKANERAQKRAQSRMHGRRR